MGFSLDGEHRLNVFYPEIIRFVLGCRGELFDDRPVKKGAVVFICRNDVIPVLPGGTLDQVKE